MADLLGRREGCSVEQGALIVAEAALFVSFVVALIAIGSFFMSRKSAAAAGRAAEAAERSADAQEWANKINLDNLQVAKRQASHQDAERERQTAARVRPVKFERKGTQSGFQLKNDGPGVAHNVIGMLRRNDGFEKGEIGSIDPRQTSSLAGNKLQPFEPTPEELNGLLEERAGRYQGRALWTNDDGSTHASKWVSIDSS